MATTNKRRALKARMLAMASVVIEESTNWEAPYQCAEELGIADHHIERMVESIANEIADELMRRSERLGGD